MRFLRACLKNKPAAGWQARRSGWRGATREHIREKSVTEEQRSQTDCPAARRPGVFFRHAPKFSALWAAALLLGGCAGYHLGPVNDQMPGDKSVEVLPFNNQTLQPRLGDAVTQALREQLQADGTYRLVDGEGDIVVSGVITGYSRQGLSFLSSDVLTANNYQVGIVAHVIVRDSTTGKVLLDKDVKGSTLVHVGSDLADAERQAMPLLAEDLAQNVTQMLAEGMW
jgi:hypothetical protein